MTSRQNNKPQKCLTCSGTGHPLVIGEEKCPECMGTGRDTKSDLWSEHCKNCNGIGKVAFCRRDYRPCRECGGLGVLHSRGIDPDTNSGNSNPIVGIVPLVLETAQLIEMIKKDGLNMSAENKILDILWGCIGGILGFIVAGPVGASAGVLIGSKIGPRMKPNVTRGSKSNIDVKYAQLGGATGFLRTAVAAETTTPDGIGRYSHFQGGSIYWTPGTGAHEVHGGIRDKWSNLGWERSFLGYPLTDEQPTEDGTSRYSKFQHGSIYWSLGTGALPCRQTVRLHVKS